MYLTDFGARKGASEKTREAAPVHSIKHKVELSVVSLVFSPTHIEFEKNLEKQENKLQWPNHFAAVLCLLLSVKPVLVLWS